MDWIESATVTYTLEWQEVTAEIAVRADLSNILFRAENNIDYYGYADDLELFLNWEKEKVEITELLFYTTSDALEYPVLGATQNIDIVAAYLVPKETVTGNDPVVVYSLINKETGGVICAKTIQAGVVMDAYRVSAFDPVNIDAASIGTGWSVSLTKTAGHMPDTLLIIEWKAEQADGDALY